MAMVFGSRRTRSSSPLSEEDSATKARFSQLVPLLMEHKKILSIVIAISIAGAFTTLAQPLVVSQVISVVEQGEPLGILVWLLIGLVIVSALLSGVRHYLLQRTGESVVLSSRMMLVRKLLRLPISEFDQRRTGDLVSRVGSDTTLLRAVLTQGLVEAIGGALTFVGAVIAMIYLDLVLFSLTAGVVAIAVTTVVVLSRRIRVASRKTQEKVGDLTASVERAISAIRTLRAANATDQELEVIDDDAKGAWRMGLDVAKISALVVPVSGIALQVAFLVVLGVGGFRVASGALPISDLVAFILFLFMMIMPLGQAFGAITSVNQALGALGRIQEIVSIPAETEGDTPADAEPTLSRHTHTAIEFDRVSFRYPTLPEDGSTNVSEKTKTADILKKVTFSIPTGSTVALVGPSGAGKSSILSLLERFYDVTRGDIKVYGRSLTSIPREELRSYFGYVEQDAPVLAGTIRQNLTIGSPDATDQQLRAVLEEVNLSGIIKRDRLGLDAQVGEGGVLLSGGERQRLAIARALLQNRPILLLDESTSSLDGPNERLMKKAIDKASQNRTVIVIAHRLATVVNSDMIIVLNQGEVEGIGTHHELLESSPLYRELAEHQLLV